LFVPSDAETDVKPALPGYASILVLPTPDPDEVMWHGPSAPPADIKDLTQVDHIIYEHQVVAYLEGKCGDASASASQPDGSSKAESPSKEKSGAKKSKKWTTSKWKVAHTLKSLKDGASVVELPKWLKTFQLKHEQEFLRKYVLRCFFVELSGLCVRFRALTEARLVKSQSEIALMTEVSRISR
jgi:hypothetical protein